MSIIIGVLNEGLIYALMALGVYITYTILDFPDPSVDSTFPMGAAVTATLILAGMPPVLTLFIAFGGRRSGRNGHRTDSCQIEGARPSFGNYRRDGPVFAESSNHGR